MGLVPRRGASRAIEGDEPRAPTPGGRVTARSGGATRGPGRAARRAAPPDELEVVRLSDVAPGESRFLVEPYLPLGAITLLEGDPAAGKSFVAAALGAPLTRGREPDLGVREPRSLPGPRSVLYVTAEDSCETLRARFAAQGADLARVLLVARPVSLRRLEALARLLARHRPALVVVDPLHALLDGVNMAAANAVRVALAPLVALAAQHGCAVLAVRHLGKAGRGRPIYRGLGSIDFSAVARSVLRVGEDPARPGSRVLVHVKSSLGPPGPTLELELGERLVWLGRSELSAHDLDARPVRSRGRSALEIAQDFLREGLRRGPRLAAEIRAAAETAGVAERTLERAQRELGVVHARRNDGPGRGRGRWVWRLPAHESGCIEEHEE